jgi:hypothetical protein
LRTPIVVAVASLCSVGLIAGCSSSTKGNDDNGPSTGGQTTPSSTGPSTNASAAPSGGQTLSSGDRRKLESDVAAAMRAATSFHMVGAGKDDDGTPIQMDVHFGPNKKVDGTIVSNGEATKIINTGDGSIYFKAPDSVWKQQAGDQAVRLLHGKWVKAPADDKRFSDLTNSLDKDDFIDSLTSDDSISDDLRKVRPVIVDGTSAIEYASASDKSQIFIAASGPPVILKGGTLPDGLLAFTDYNKDYPFAPPPAAQTVDVSKLGN